MCDTPLEKQQMAERKVIKMFYTLQVFVLQCLIYEINPLAQSSQEVVCVREISTSYEIEYE